MTKTTPLVLALALGLGLAAGPAQANEAEKKGEAKAMSFGLDALKERFEAAAPDVGKRVPDIQIYTASGDKVRFRDLAEGHYSVVVFGCLT